MYFVIEYEIRNAIFESKFKIKIELHDSLELACIRLRLIFRFHLANLLIHEALARTDPHMGHYELAGINVFCITGVFR